MRKSLRLGLVGVNKQGREHLDGADACNDISISAVCDVSGEAMEKVRSSYPGVDEFYNDIGEFLNKAQIDGIILALPHHVYAKHWKELLAKGLPILKEKPLGRTLQEAKMFVQTAAEAKVPVVTAIQRRSHPSYQVLHERLKEETVLHVSAYLHLGFDPAKPPKRWRGNPSKAGGGALLDSGYHMVDLVHYLLGPMELIHANCWHEDRPATAEMLETEVRIVARAGDAWVLIESLVGGEPCQGGYAKKEELIAETNSGQYRANREGLCLNESPLFCCTRQWTESMAAQLNNFADMIHKNEFDHPNIWEQLPAMRFIEVAYQRSLLEAAHVVEAANERQP